MVTLRKRHNLELEERFREAYKCYIRGDWANAENLLDSCLKLEPHDGPTQTLKGYIA